MAEDKNVKNQKETENEQLSLNDDRRVKVLSPGALVVKRFFRNRLAVVGLVMLASMFIFSFLGGLIMPYGQAEQFYTYTYLDKEYVGVTRNNDLRYAAAEGQEFGALLQSQFLLALGKGNTEYTYKDVDYHYVEEGTDFYSIWAGDTILAIAYKDIVNAADGMADPPFAAKYEGLKLYSNGETGAFTAGGVSYTLDEDGNILQGGQEIGYISRFVVQSKERLEEALEDDIKEFVYTGEDGEEHTYTVAYDGLAQVWSVMQATVTYVWDQYAQPSKAHPLGTDSNGMDMLVRLMYGGRVSLVIGVIMGGIAGYFGKWVDNIIMRIVDVFYCIPSTPIIIILGATMDNMQMDPQLRMLYLMLLLGFLGWSAARSSPCASRSS